LSSLALLVAAVAAVPAGSAGGLSSAGSDVPVMSSRLATGLSHSCALTASATVKCWGSGAFGQLGDGQSGTGVKASSPVTVMDSTTSKPLANVAAISAGKYHTCALLAGGTVKCWGQGASGQLGLGTGTTLLTRAQNAASSVSSAVAIAAGDLHSCALLVGGTVKCWGENASGQIGNNTRTDAFTPVTVLGSLAGVAGIAAGGSHSCARLQDGKVKCWGEDGSGQIGNNTLLDDALTPQAVGGGLTSVAGIAAGGKHTCAVLATGGIKCWGENGSWQIGNNAATSMTDVKVPASGVTGVAGAVAVSAGGSHSCARLGDGTVKCWGENGSWQTGNNAATGADVKLAAAVPGLSGAAATSGLAAGGSHTCVQTSGAGVLCWGSNSSGQIGDGSTTSPRKTPQPVGSLGAASAVVAPVAVAAAEAHSCSQRLNGALACWGRNASGQLGDGTTNSSLTPVNVEDIAGASAVAVGLAHTCAIVPGQAVECWGDNTHGQLGDGTNNPSTAPVAVRNADDSPLVGVTALVAGAHHTCAIASGGVKCWGRNNSGQLGTSSPGAESNEAVPVTGLVGTITQIAAGGGTSDHTCARSTTGAVRCWGRNLNGQLGNGGTTDSPTAVAVSGLGAASTVAVGSRHTCAVVSGAVKCWGANFDGQLGDNTTDPSSTPVPTGLTSARSLTAGGDVDGHGHSCALLTNNTVWCWGDNAYGQLGDASYIDRLVPTATVELASISILSAGASHACAVDTAGVVKCWGRNDDGQLGDGTTNSSNVPVKVGLTTVTAVGAGAYHTCNVLLDKTVTCQGYNVYGQLGNGTFSDSSPSAVPVQDLTNAIAVEASFEHSCALVAGGSAKCWGYNEHGQLGNGTVTATSPWGIATAVQVKNAGGTALTGISALAVGELHSCALINAGPAGTVKCWGYNGFGQLGDGTGTSSAAPVDVKVTGGGILTGVIAINAGGYFLAHHTCALMVDKTVACWGNVFGGAGSFAEPIAGVTDVEEVASGALHFCVRRTGGTVACWGDNSEGQLGDGTNDDSSVPVEVLGITNATAIAGDYFHSCARLADKTMRCWGENNSGQLGDGTTDDSNVPVQALGVSGVQSGSGKLSAGYGHTCAVVGGDPLLGGNAKCWGLNQYGQLGTGTAGGQTTPTPVALPDLTAVSSGGGHTCARLAEGILKCWGDNSSGELGTTTSGFTSVATFLLAPTGATSVAAGGAHSCAVIVDGTARCWGSDSDGQLGDGAAVTTGVPVTVGSPSPLTNVAQLAAGSGHTCALLSGGGVRCWGDNQYGQLGNGTTGTDSLTPVTVLSSDGTTLGSVTAISAGTNHTCARLSGGTVKCWGANPNGQLGNAATAASANKAVVVKLGTASLSGVTSVAAGGSHSCARVASGKVYCWGSDATGQLGNGAAGSSTSAVQVSTLTTATAVTAGQAHACARLAAGTVQCWGDSTYGQVGNGTTGTSWTVPKAVSSAASGSPVVSVSAGAHHTCALRANGTARCWGRNDLGQLGDGTTNNQSSAVIVVL
jgi:alpha-tubulin suppressor-like RCC1 family protein